jgi:hypothetical protein
MNFDFLNIFAGTESGYLKSLGITQITIINMDIQSNTNPTPSTTPY